MTAIAAQLDMVASDAGVRILLLDDRGTVLHDTDNNNFAGRTFPSRVTLGGVRTSRRARSPRPLAKRSSPWRHASATRDCSSVWRHACRGRSASADPWRRLD